LGTGNHSGTVVGNGNGEVSDSQFLFTITWNNGTKGQYNGNFGLSGRLTGITFDLNHPEVQATWHISKEF
jgi:hypothetical protein